MCPKRSASSTAASETCFAPPSTMTSALAEPATMMLRSAASISAWVGFAISLPSTRETRTAAIGDGNGTSESITAADAPTNASTSVSYSGSAEITCAVTWVSSR